MNERASVFPKCHHDPVPSPSPNPNPNPGIKGEEETGPKPTLPYFLRVQTQRFLKFPVSNFTPLEGGKKKREKSKKNDGSTSGLGLGFGFGI